MKVCHKRFDYYHRMKVWDAWIFLENDKYKKDFSLLKLHKKKRTENFHKVAYTNEYRYILKYDYSFFLSQSLFTYFHVTIFGLFNTRFCTRGYKHSKMLQFSFYVFVISVNFHIQGIDTQLIIKSEINDRNDLTKTWICACIFN